MRNRYVLLADVAAIGCATFGAFVLRFDLRFFQSRPEFPAFLAAALLIKPTIFHGFGLYHRYWRYATVRDLNAVVFACGATTVAMSLFVGFGLAFGFIQEFSRAVLVIDSLLMLMAAGGIRMSVRIVHEPRVGTRKGRWLFGQKEAAVGKRVLVVGAGNAGTMVVREMQRNPQLEMEAVAFLDDDPVKRGKRIYEVPVLGNAQSLGRIVRTRRIDEVIIAMPTAPGAAVRKVVEACQTLGLRSQTIPGVFELLDGKVSVSRLRHVEIADLLRRRQVEGSVDSSSYVTGQTVLITGAGGSIGGELCRQAAHARPRRLVMLGHGENSLFDTHAKLHHAYPDVLLDVVVADIRDRMRIERIFQQLTPDIVFHAAAHKHVPLMEENFEDVISNNVVGTNILVDAALQWGAKRFVGISTDKAVSPSGVMGASKRMASLIVRDAARRSGRSFAVVRFGNVLGSRGSVVPYFKGQIERGGPVTITHPEMKRFFMTILEAIHLVLEAGGMGKGGELFVLNMGEPVRIIDLAEDLIHLSGFTTDQIPIISTGIRPSEKLEEALWEDDAKVEPTAHPDILRVTEPLTPAGDLRAAVEALEHTAREGDRLRAEALLRDWIPTFTPWLTSLPSGVAPRVSRVEAVTPEPPGEYRSLRKPSHHSERSIQNLRRA